MDYERIYQNCMRHNHATSSSVSASWSREAFLDKHCSHHPGYYPGYSACGVDYRKKQKIVNP